MRRFEGIIESTVPPISRNVLWIDKGVLKYCRNGQWAVLQLQEGEPVIPDPKKSPEYFSFKIDMIEREIELIESKIEGIDTITSFNDPFWVKDTDPGIHRFEAIVESDTLYRVTQINEPSSDPTYSHNWWCLAYSRVIKRPQTMTVKASVSGKIIIDGKIQNADGSSTPVRVQEIAVPLNTATKITTPTIYQEDITYDRLYMYFLPDSMEDSEYTVELVNE